MNYRLLLFSMTMFFSMGCDMFKSEDTKNLETLNEKLTQLNDSFIDQKIEIGKALSEQVFKDKKKESFSMLIYYDANCSVCFSQLEKWKKTITYFKKVDKNLNIKFILFSDDVGITDRNLTSIGFPKSFVVYDDENKFLEKYPHILDKPYNTMLLNKNDEIIFIGSPVISANLKKHFTKLITD